MAITQDRMLSLIAAAQFYQAEFLNFQRLVSSYYSRSQKDPVAAQMGMTLLQGAIASALHGQVMHDPVITREEYHFKKFAKRNDYTRRYAKGKKYMNALDEAPARHTRKPMTSAPTKASAIDRMIAKRDELEAQSLMHAAEARVAALEAAAIPKTLELGVNLVDSTPTDPSLVTKLDIKIL